MVKDVKVIIVEAHEVQLLKKAFFTHPQFKSTQDFLKVCVHNFFRAQLILRILNFLDSRENGLIIIPEGLPILWNFFGLFHERSW